MRENIIINGVDATGKTSEAESAKFFLESNNIIVNIQHLTVSNSIMLKVKAAQIVFYMYSILSKEQSRISTADEKQLKKLIQTYLQKEQGILEKQSLQQHPNIPTITIFEGLLFARAAATYYTLFPDQSKDTFLEYEQAYKKNIDIPLLLEIRPEKQQTILAQRQNKFKNYIYFRNHFPYFSTASDLVFLSSWFDFKLADDPQWCSQYTNQYNNYIKQVFPEVQKYNVVEGSTIEIKQHLREKLNGLKTKS